MFSISLPVHSLTSLFYYGTSYSSWNFELPWSLLSRDKSAGLWVVIFFSGFGLNLFYRTKKIFAFGVRFYLLRQYLRSWKILGVGWEGSHTWGIRKYTTGPAHASDVEHNCHFLFNFLEAVRLLTLTNVYQSRLPPMVSSPTAESYRLRFPPQDNGGMLVSLAAVVRVGSKLAPRPPTAAHSNNTFHSHIWQIRANLPKSGKSTFTLSGQLITRIRHFINLNALKLIYSALVYPYLIYGNLIWGNTYKKRIQKLMNIKKILCA